MPSSSKHVSEHIDRSAAEVYGYVVDPTNLPSWAHGVGPARVAFAARNDLGVLDHVVTTASGDTVYVPMRVVPDGDGSEVVFTVRRMPGMTEEELERDAGLVAADLLRLKQVLEG